jgi:hypothetical protein
MFQTALTPGGSVASAADSLSRVAFSSKRIAASDGITSVRQGVLFMVASRLRFKRG